MRAATISDGSVAVRGPSGPRTRKERDSRAGPRRGHQRGRHPPAKGRISGPAGLAGRHPGARAGRRGGGAGPGREPLLGGRPRDGDRGRRRPGRAGGRARARPRCRCPTGSTGRPAGGFPEVFTTAHDAIFSQAGAARRASTCSCTAAPGASGTAAIQLGRAAGARVTATVRSEESRPEVEALGADRDRARGLRGARAVRRRARARRARRTCPGT